jgi:hypothetical protein
MDTLISFDDYGDGALRCPGCGGGNLHHTYVVSYDRAEDAAETIETHIEGGRSVRRVSDSKRNPGSRRGGIAIGFYCETYDVEPELTIAQHKGTSYAEWRDKDLPAEQIFSRKEATLAG